MLTARTISTVEFAMSRPAKGTTDQIPRPAHSACLQACQVSHEFHRGQWIGRQDARPSASA